SGAGGVAVGPEYSPFAAALTQVCKSLAQQVVADGEGITHVVELQNEGAASDADALTVARSIAHSPLVKTAWAGGDPNWGRIMAAIGYAGVAIVPVSFDISFGELEICRAAGLSPRFNEAATHDYLKQRDLTIHVNLGLGSGS